jgi:hypothetical protein
VRGGSRPTAVWERTTAISASSKMVNKRTGRASGQSSAIKIHLGIMHEIFVLRVNIDGPRYRIDGWILLNGGGHGWVSCCWMGEKTFYKPFTPYLIVGNSWPGYGTQGHDTKIFERKQRNNQSFRSKQPVLVVYVCI